MKYTRKIFHPPNYIIILGFFCIIFSLAYLIFFNGFEKNISYLLYLLMTYSLIIICIKIYDISKKKIDILIENNKYFKRYKTDYELRYKTSLFLSLLFNIIYAIFKIVMGIIYNSVWAITFGLYYILLVVLRGLIAKEETNENSSIIKEYMKYRNTGVILLLINIILSMIILIIINEKIINIYPDWLAITSAVYTFYLIIRSIYGLIKYRKYNNPLMFSAKIINVVTSLISLISLEIILIPTFGVNNIDFFEITVIATGGGIAIIIVIISLYMIITGTKWLKNNAN